MTRRCHQLETFSALLALCAGNSPVTDEIPSQRPVTRSFDVFFDLRLNKRLCKQSRHWWFETSSRSLSERKYTNFVSIQSSGWRHIGKIMKFLKNKMFSGHDGISIKLLKFLSPALVKPLSLIINQSLLTGIFPEKLKMAKVLPPFKKGGETLIEKCRPVWILTSISKVFEKVVFIQLSKYFQDNGLFY